MKVIVAISGASGAIYGIRLLESLARLEVETHLVLSGWAVKTIEIETDYSVEAVRNMTSKVYAENDQAAAISSGSFKTAGMAVIPCSMKTLAAISHGLNSNLICRAADVTLKERRRLIVMPREAPYNSIHLENMLRLTNAGGIVLPPNPAFYNRPKTIDDLVNHTVGRVLDLLGIENELVSRWG